MMKFRVFIVLLGVLFAQEEEFIISYQAKMKNDLLSGESYKISRVISPKGRNGIKEGRFEVSKMCQIIPDIDDESKVRVEKILRREKEKVLDCLYASGVKIYDEAIAKNLEARSKTIFKIPPKRVIVKLENGVINLNVLEKK